MKGDKTKRVDGNKEDKVPIIRLKLKVAAREAVGTPGEDIKAVDRMADERDTTGMDTLTAPQDTIPRNSLSPVQDTIPHNSSSPVHVAIPQNSSSPTSSAKFYGTFKYRPFKLFPLLPPSSRYRVLVPSKHLSARNPAVRLRYLWQPGRSGGDGAVYTDDSDLVCVIVREGWVKNLGEINGKNLLVEVEVVRNDVNDSKDGAEDDHRAKDNRNFEDNRHNRHVNHDFKHADDLHSADCPITTRYYDNHDGHCIRVTSCTTDPSAVHLKRWRKRKPTTTNRLVTPEFKTKS